MRSCIDFLTITNRISLFPLHAAPESTVWMKRCCTDEYSLIFSDAYAIRQGSSESCCKRATTAYVLTAVHLIPNGPNIGVFICLKCSGVHRSLGTHVSKVLSVTLDQWADDEINSMIEVGGNSYANAIYEAFLPEGYHKPHPDSSQEERADFIRSKYELQEFLKPSLRLVSNKGSLEATGSRKHTGSNVSLSASFNSEAGMVEFIGILKIKVIRGTKLAVRDLISSDPYVVLTLGQQKAKTSVIKRNLNPIWNEELKLSVPQQYGPLKLQVFDHDMLSRDDKMGDAEIDLQPMISAATAFGDPDLLADMQIGKWLKSPDNTLARDSAVNVIGGKVKQEVSLRLQNVESGEVELELEWIPLNQ